MNSLTKFEQNGLELFVNEESGEVFATQAALVRMTGKSKSTISDWAKGVRESDTIYSEILTTGGMQGVRLFTENAVYEALAKYAPDLLIQCAKAGIRVYLHTLAGYKFKVLKPEPQVAIMSPGELLKLQAEAIIKLEQEQEKLRLEQAAQAEKIKELEAFVHQHDAEIDRIFCPNGRYYTVMGYWKAQNKGALGLKEAARIGKACTKFCSDNNIPVEHLPDPRFGQVNSYPQDVIERFI